MVDVRVLFLAAEVNPFTKVGGLGDVAGSLPAALRNLGHDVRIFTPAHRTVEDNIRSGASLSMRPPVRVPLAGSEVEAGVLEASLPGSGVPVYFLAQRDLFDRDRVYGYPDDTWRYSVFCRAVFVALEALDWRPDVVHAHDWHTAAAVCWLARSGDPVFGGIPTVFTIHNLFHQGVGEAGLLRSLGIPAPGLPEDGAGSVNLMAHAIDDATVVSTVSPTYAREILRPDGGAGLHALLARRPEAPAGIVNGLDYGEWDPGHDSLLAEPYDAQTLEKRPVNRSHLERDLGLPHSGAPLVVMVSRLERQKGIDLLPAVVHLMSRHPSGVRLAVLGSGPPELTQVLRELCVSYPDRVASRLDRFDNELAHELYGAGDLFLMPSLFEPCGLSQLIAMRYGCVPVVRATGGLADTVEEGRTGFLFQAFDADACWGALERALDCLSERPARWKEIQRAGMSGDWSWSRSARSYDELYRSAIGQSRRAGGLAQ